ncbi:MAG: SDR family oxidoreductase, partial [[Clostridium] innocuum]
PLGRPGHLYEVADLICYLISDHASYITGVTIPVSGGKSKG